MTPRVRWISSLRRRLRLPPRVGILLYPALIAPLLLVAVLPLRAPLRLSVSLLLIGAGLAVLHWAPRLRVAALLFGGIASLRYLWWRATETLAWELTPDGILGMLLLATECYGFFVYIGGAWQAAVRRERKPAPILGPVDALPTVDVFVPTYNESVDILRRTLVGATGIRWPRKRVYVLDDGKRPEVSSLAAELGCVYLTRPDNRGAKAGNLNAALARTDGELVAVFDADHVPVESFLEVTVGFFQADPQVALVQTPHHFYNPDPFGRNLHIAGHSPPEQAWFYHNVLKGSDFWNAAFFCGSCAVLRRSALAEVGGIAQETVTEDAHTALKLHARGWRSVYLDLPQAAGLATERFAFHIAQRIRWARGMIQILRLDNPLFRPGLRLPQRFHYLLAASHFLFGIPRLILLMTPAAWLVTGLHPIQASPAEILVMALPHLVLAAACVSVLNGNTRHSFWPEVYETAIAPWLAVVSVVTLAAPRRGKFNVTPKGGGGLRYRFDLRSAWPLLALFTWCVLGFVAVPWRLAHEPDSAGTLSLALAWNLYNATLLAAAVAVCLERPERRATPRVPAAGTATLASVQGDVLDLGEGGARLRLPGMPPSEAILALGDVAFPVRTVNVTPAADGVVVQVAFPPLRSDEKQRVLRRMFCAPDTWLRDRFPADAPLNAAFSVVSAPLRSVWAWLRGRAPARPPTGDRMIALTTRACGCGTRVWGGGRCPRCGSVGEGRPRPRPATTSRWVAAVAVVALAAGLAPGLGVDPAAAAGVRPVRALPDAPPLTETLTGVHAELARIAREVRFATYGARPPSARGEKSIWSLTLVLDHVPDVPGSRESMAVRALRAAAEDLREAIRSLGRTDPKDVRASLARVDLRLEEADEALVAGVER